MFAKAKQLSKRKLVAGLMLLVAGALIAAAAFGFVRGGSDAGVGLPQGDLRDLIPTQEPTPSPGSEPIPSPPPSESPPVRLVIDKIGVDAPVEIFSVDADGVPEVPWDPDTVAWYDFSAKPGHGSNVDFSGHVNWTVDGQVVLGVFWQLGELEEGDIIQVRVEDGTEYLYQVTANLAVEWDDPEAIDLLYPTPDEVITLSTCGGTWVPDGSRLGGNYTHRMYVRGEPVAGQPAAVMPASGP